MLDPACGVLFLAAKRGGDRGEKEEKEKKREEKKKKKNDSREGKAGLGQINATFR